MHMRAAYTAADGELSHLIRTLAADITPAVKLKVSKRHGVLRTTLLVVALPLALPVFAELEGPTAAVVYIPLSAYSVPVTFTRVANRVGAPVGLIKLDVVAAVVGAGDIKLAHFVASVAAYSVILKDECVDHHIVTRIELFIPALPSTSTFVL